MPGKGRCHFWVCVGGERGGREGEIGGGVDGGWFDIVCYDVCLF